MRLDCDISDGNFDAPITKAEGSIPFLPELPPSEWRSLGKRLDYVSWPSRDRFRELDAAIYVIQQLQASRNAERFVANLVENEGHNDLPLCPAA